VVLVCLVLGFDAGQAVDVAAAEPVAGAFEGEDVGVVDDPVDHRGGGAASPGDQVSRSAGSGRRY
jgi:hypothetical protein